MQASIKQIKTSIRQLSPVETYIWATRSYEIVEIIEKIQDGLNVPDEDVIRIKNILKYIYMELDSINEKIDSIRDPLDRDEFQRKWEAFKAECNDIYNQRVDIRRRFINDIYDNREAVLRLELESSPWTDNAKRKLRVIKSRREQCLANLEY